MVIFHSYVSLPEGNYQIKLALGLYNWKYNGDISWDIYIYKCESSHDDIVTGALTAPKIFGNKSFS